MVRALDTRGEHLVVLTGLLSKRAGAICTIFSQPEAARLRAELGFDRTAWTSYVTR
jgi:hypothetical protein